MPAAPSHELLVALGEDLQMPPEWRDLARRATAAVERRWLLAGLRRRLLVASPAGRARLRRWIDLQRLEPTTPTPPWLLPRWIHERVVVYGDFSMMPLVVEALCRAPAPVRDAALREAAFLAVGKDCLAWTGSSNLVDRNGDRVPQLVVLGPEVDVRLLLHELAHVWNKEVLDYSALVTTQGEARVIELARREGWLDRAERQISRGERIADACGWLWDAQGER